MRSCDSAGNSGCSDLSMQKVAINISWMLNFVLYVYMFSVLATVIFVML